MFTHIMLGANDVEASRQFYDAIFATLGIGAGVKDAKGRYFYITPRGAFAISQPINGEPACHGNGSTVGFYAKTPEAVEAWHAAGIANGGTRCEEPPGIRQGTLGKLHLAYLRDPSGNKICAVHRY